MKLYFVRHGQSEWNAEGRIQGQADPVLNEKGLEQAKSIAENLEGEEISEIYSSDLKRAYQTAEVFAQKFDMDIKVDMRLRECHFGSFQGKSWDQVQAETGETKSDYYEDDYVLARSFTNVGGESIDEIVSRISEFVEELKAKNKDNVLIVGHGVSLTMYLRSIGQSMNTDQGSYEIVEY